MREKAEEIGYVRTSRKDEIHENQIHAIQEKTGKIRIFEDLGVSGIEIAKSRKGFAEMLGYIEENDVNKLYVFELSRIGRTFIETLETVNQLEQQGITVISVSPKEGWLSVEDKSIRQLIMAIFAWVAERERENLIERTKAGIDRARSEGKHIGRPLKKIDWKEYKKWRAKGLSKSAIGRIMDIPYPTLINHIQMEKIE